MASYCKDLFLFQKVTKLETTCGLTHVKQNTICDYILRTHVKHKVTQEITVTTLKIVLKFNDHRLKGRLKRNSVLKKKLGMINPE
jgi:hypothetical protein